MKKPLLLVMMASVLATGSMFVPHTASASPANGQQAAQAVFSYGAKNQSIVDLQLRLQKLGYFKYPVATGYFGSYTVSAVRKFQRDYSLPVTGTANATTREQVRHAVIKAKLVQASKWYIGTPYVWGGKTPSGFDCSGFVWYMYNKLGIPMHRTSASVLYHSGWYVHKQNLMPGDLVFFSARSNGSITHVGIYIGAGKFICATSSRGVQIQSLNTGYWGQRYVGAKRVY